MKKSNFFKRKKVTASFAIFALAGGFLFLNQGITGNVILSGKSSINLLSIIGLLLILCSIILGIYSIKKR